MWLSGVHFWLVWGPEGALELQMVDLRCQDTDEVGGFEKHFRCDFTV